jgi:general secretion pathway protein A
MYNSFFGFNEKPFNITPDPRFFYGNPLYSEVYANLLYAVRERKGFATLIGEVGTGKTTLLRKLMDDLAITARFVYFYNTKLNFEELLSFVCQELALPLRRKEGRLGKIRALNEFLIDQLRDGRTAVLLIDEAQNLGNDVLENLRLLSNLETGREKLLQIILAGQPEFESKLAEPELRQLKQRISIHCRINCLSECEVERFVNYRLAAVGCERRDLFGPETLIKIAYYSGGVPRLVNIICDNALLIAYANSQKTITAAIIDEVADDLMLLCKNQRSEPSRAAITIKQDYPAEPKLSTVAANSTGAQNGEANESRLNGEIAEMENRICDDGIVTETSVLKICDGDKRQDQLVALTADELRIVSRIDGYRDVKAIAENSYLSYETTAKVLRKLRHSGIVDVVPTKAQVDVVPQEFVDAMRSEFTKVVGPMAGFLLRERISAFGHSPKEFPKSQLNKLVEAVSTEILHDQLRKEFRTRMAEMIRELKARTTITSKGKTRSDSDTMGLEQIG